MLFGLALFTSLAVAQAPDHDAAAAPSWPAPSLGLPSDAEPQSEPEPAPSLCPPGCRNGPTYLGSLLQAPVPASHTEPGESAVRPTYSLSPLAPPRPADEKPADDKKEPKRRGLPGPLLSPPLPSAEYQGYPLIGVPYSPTHWTLMKILQGTYYGDVLNGSRINVYGWVDVGANASTSRNSNIPMAYGIVPNSVQLDQLILRFERLLDTAQTDRVDWGFRFTQLYGMDYRYTTALGYLSNQLLQHNFLYGYDPLEIYGELYVPWVKQGLVLRLGRYISPPDIEAQLAPDNYLYSHSLLYTYDAYTHTGLLASLRLDAQNIVQAAIFAGNDMAPWSRAAEPTAFLGWRWVSKDNNDSVYTCVNSLNDAHYRHPESLTANHDNFNYVVTTWSHRFNQYVLTATESYYMWQFNALLGGTPSFGPVRPFGGGGGPGPIIPGLSSAWGVLNYTMFVTSPRDYITVRNEYWDDSQGMRTGFATCYTSHTIGWAHQFTPYLQVRPEIDYLHSYQHPAFDNGTRKNQLVIQGDVIIRF